jgi:hypothetical protein
MSVADLPGRWVNMQEYRLQKTAATEKQVGQHAGIPVVKTNFWGGSTCRNSGST